MTYKLRFKYDGTWTRWFNQGEDLLALKGKKIEAAEVIETMTEEEFYKLYDDLDEFTEDYYICQSANLAYATHWATAQLQ